MPTLEDELRATMVEASEHLQLPAGTADRAWRRGHRAVAERNRTSWRRASNRAGARSMSHYPRGRLVALTGLLVVAVIVTAFALGGKSTESGGASAGQFSINSPVNGRGVAGNGGGVSNDGQLQALHPGAPAAEPRVPAGHGPAGAKGTSGTSGSTGSNSFGKTPSAASTASGSGVSTSGVTATRVVKNGSMDLEVSKGHVQATVDKLVNLTTGLGGYVAQSHTSNVAGSPSGEVTLRMPVNKFEAAVSAAQKVGHETALTTSAHDVTGKFVDLNARLSALQRTRQTYLTILGRATTIGQTLEVQQRIEDVQQQIEQLQGSLKVLRNQSADGTLTVAVSERGSAAVIAPHQRHGIGKAWHTSVHRFTRGIDAIIAALGPLLLVLLVLAVLVVIAGLGYRGVRRATG